ncbi:MAG: extracellular solute-binding protein [Anaerolineales bacterium]|nr:extracellular solute-binding protein [Anaerolineales bacterium]
MKRNISAVALVAILLSLVLSACAVPAAAPTVDGGQEVDAQGGETTLLVWDIWTREADSQVVDQLDQEFEAANPGVKIDRVVKSFDDMKATAQLALSTPEGPDVAQINQGESDMVALVRAGLLADLTDYAAQYAWADRWDPSLVLRNSVKPDGSAYGEGSLYGMAPTAEFVGVFYNKDKFAAAGIEVPKTFAEFEAALAKLKEAGETPIAFGDLDGWPAIHTFSEAQGVFLGEEDPAYLDDFIYARGNVGFDNPANLKAAQKLVEWVDAGYFTPDFLGVAMDDAFQQFSAGDAAMFLTGSWVSGDLAAGPNADKMGFFLMPGSTEGARKPVVAGTSTAYTIRAGSEKKDLAAKYIDWMMSDRAMELFAGTGLVPVKGLPADKVAEGTLFADLIAAWDQVRSTNSIGHYLDWATPTFYNTITASLQELLGKQITPEEFIAKNQADYDAWLVEKGVKQ